jgi:hypothetical protein
LIFTAARYGDCGFGIGYAYDSENVVPKYLANADSEAVSISGLLCQAMLQRFPGLELHMLAIAE